MDVVPKNRLFDNAFAWFAGIFLASLGFLLFGTSRIHIFSPGTRVDLGDVSIGQTAEKTFAIFNHSSKPLMIAGWAPTCHCIQARFPQTLVLPEKSINAYVKTSATTPLGQRAAVIAVHWHFVGDSVMRTDNLVVSAKYVSPFSLSEDRLDFLMVPSSESRTKSLSVRTGNTGGNWNGLDIAPASDRLSVRVQPTPSGFQVQAQIDPRGLPAGVWKSTLRLFTLQNGTRTGEEIDVPVVARIEGPFSVDPPVLQFFEQPNRALCFTLKIHSSTVAIRKLRVLGEIVQKAAIEITGDGKDAIVTGFLTKPVSNGIFVGKIPLQINDDPEGCLQMSFIGYPG
jgi:hypothetical protein